MAMPRLMQVMGKKIHLARVKHATTFAQRFMGLMGVSPKDFDYALVFHLAAEGKLSASIHMLFMRMPIDVVFLDGEKNVVDAVEELPAWALNYTPSHAAKYIVELPAGTIAKYNITKGLHFSWDK